MTTSTIRTLRHAASIAIAVAALSLLSRESAAQGVEVVDVQKEIGLGVRVKNAVKNLAELRAIQQKAAVYYWQWVCEITTIEDFYKYKGDFAKTLLLDVGHAQLSHDIDSLGKDGRTAFNILNGGPIGLINQGYSGLVTDLSTPNTDGGVLYNTLGREHQQIAVVNTLNKTQMATTSTFRAESAQTDAHLDTLDQEIQSPNQFTKALHQRQGAAILEIGRALKYAEQFDANSADQHTVWALEEIEARTEALNINSAWQDAWGAQVHVPDTGFPE